MVCLYLYSPCRTVCITFSWLLLCIHYYVSIQYTDCFGELWLLKLLLMYKQKMPQWNRVIVEKCTCIEFYCITSTSVFGGGHMSTHADPTSTRRVHLSSMTFVSAHLERRSDAGWPYICWLIRPILGFQGAKFPKMCDYLSRMPMNHHAKFDRR